MTERRSLHNIMQPGPFYFNAKRDNLCVARLLQMTRRLRSPGRSSCSESAVSTSLPVLSARKVRCKGLRSCCQDDVTTHRSSADEHRPFHKDHLSIALRKERSFSPCHLIVYKHTLPSLRATSVATGGPLAVLNVLMQVQSCYISPKIHPNR